MKILNKYKPKWIEIQGHVIDLNQVGRLSMEQETKASYKVPKLSWLGTRPEDREFIGCLPTGRYYIWIQAKDNHYNLQEYYNTEKEAKKQLNKLKRYLNEEN